MQGQCLKARLQFLLFDLDVVRPGIFNAALQTPNFLRLEALAQTYHKQRDEN
jgi:hypothetical protein